LIPFAAAGMLPSEAARADIICQARSNRMEPLLAGVTKLPHGQRNLGTVHEVITARHAGLNVVGLSLVANHAAGVIEQRLIHEDVTRAAASAADALGRLVLEVIRRLPTGGEASPPAGPRAP